MYGVLKSILGRASEAFGQLFNGPQGAFITGSDTYEQLPIMRLTDNATDVDHFLRAVFCPWYLIRLRRLQKDRKHGLLRVPPGYYGILRLAQKYMAYEFIPELMDVFHEVWPIDLPAWLEKEISRLKKVYESGPPPNPDGNELDIEWDQTDLLPDPISTYAFALEHPALYDILPTVAYDIVHSHTVPVPSNDGGFRRLDFSLLDQQDTLNLRAGGEVLRLDCLRKLDFDGFTGISLRVERCLHTPGVRYPDDLACYDGLRKFWRRNVVPLVSLTRPIDFLEFPTTCFAEGVCPSCAAAVVGHLNNAKYVMWAKLPIYFRLTGIVSPGWGLGFDADERINLLPRPWQDEVRAVLNVAQDPDAGPRMFEQLRNGPLL
ncbi:hypothetical protein PENSPDRAFT_688655 [Peniophora sp. CONT]|nr:hypothetical protein PENSPDRAFT_688655 [Peniophora sp. CONT]